MELEREIEATIYDFNLNGMTPKRTAKRIMALIAEQNKTSGSKSFCNGGLEAATLAKRFHETYERLAPKLDYKTRHESAVPWHKVPDKNKMLMIAVCEKLLKEGI